MKKILKVPDWHILSCIGCPNLDSCDIAEPGEEIPRNCPLDDFPQMANLDRVVYTHADVLRLVEQATHTGACLGALTGHGFPPALTAALAPFEAEKKDAKPTDPAITPGKDET